MLIILFGLTGSGKNFVGDIFQKHFGYHFWDADDVLTAEMKKNIENNVSFTQSMRDEFTQNLIDHIARLSDQYQNLVVAQALYKEKNRVAILEKFPQALFILVEAQSEIISKRLKKRANSVTENYAAQIISHFEPPALPHQKIMNDDTEQSIIKQLELILSGENHEKRTSHF